jgi:hypothetical protein
MMMRMAQTVRRLVVVAIALVAIVAAAAWASVTFTDRSFACGTAFGEARHGEVNPALVVERPLSPGLHEITLGPGTRFVTLCRGQARARLVESGGVILLALLAVGFALRPRRKQPPEIATM